jgi:hypothetical protein
MKIEISKLNMKSINLVRKGDEVTTKERWVLNNTNVGIQLQRILAFKVPDPRLPRLDVCAKGHILDHSNMYYR